MTLFWLSAVIVLSCAALALLFPFIRTSNAETLLAPSAASEAQQKRARENVQNFQEKLTEMQRELEAGALTPEDFQKIKSEMERVLYDDAFGGQSSAQKNASTALPKALLLGALLVLVAASFGVYFKIGAYDRVADVQASGPGSAPHAQGTDPQIEQAVANRDMDALVAQLHTKLQTMPDNLEGWMLLAKSALNIGRYDLAEEAYRRVITLVEKEGKSTAPFYGLLAQALYFQAQGTISPKVRQALDAAFAINAEEVNSLALLAMNHFEAGNFEAAIQYWQRILTADPQHPSRAMIEEGIAQARTRLGQPVVSGETADKADKEKVAAPTELAAQAAIQVRVTLANGAAQDVSPETTVFIFARAPSGPPMPVAASRHTLSELPLTLTLSDANAMGPMAKLSQFERVNLVARISTSGQPTAQPGDWEGIVEGVQVGQNELVELVISQQR